VPKKPKKSGASGGTPATVALTATGTEFTLHAYDHDPSSPSYGEEAAEALGVSPDRVFKTLVADVDGELTVAVVPVAGQLDLKALAAAVGGKRATMADPAAAERTTGYVRGGISPLGQRKRLRTVLDTSADTHPTICVSAGRRGLEVELSPKDLTTLTSAVRAPIGRA
jgi:Cys-tRNA(Pro)/Cys-tRNA(Cys) deacylase